MLQFSGRDQNCLVDVQKDPHCACLESTQCDGLQARATAARIISISSLMCTTHWGYTGADFNLTVNYHLYIRPRIIIPKDTEQVVLHYSRSTKCFDLQSVAKKTCVHSDGFECVLVSAQLNHLSKLCVFIPCTLQQPKQLVFLPIDPTEVIIIIII